MPCLHCTCKYTEADSLVDFTKHSAAHCSSNEVSFALSSFSLGTNSPCGLLLMNPISSSYKKRAWINALSGLSGSHTEYLYYINNLNMNTKTLAAWFENLNFSCSPKDFQLHYLNVLFVESISFWRRVESKVHLSWTWCFLNENSLT
jgi:hypothetical protein